MGWQSALVSEMVRSLNGTSEFHWNEAAALEEVSEDI